MVTAAQIYIWGELVGAVQWSQKRGLASFEYAPSYIKNGQELAPIQMPLKNGIYQFPNLKPSNDIAYDTFKGLPGLLADSLPDKYGNELINIWLAQQGRPANSMNPVEQLCFIGKRAMGALEFIPSVVVGKGAEAVIEIDQLVDVARKMLKQRSDFNTNIEQEQKALKQILTIGTSAGGARPKAVIAYNEKTRSVRSGQAKAPNGYEHWLIKLDGVSDAQFGESLGWGNVEYAYYLMAKDCGITMMPSLLLEEGNRAHFMTKRFDREGANTKHHIQTFCAMQHADFTHLNSFSYEQLFQCMRQLKLTYPEAEQVYRRMVFNILATNCDDHTKNFAFLLKKGGKWELSPAYDICYAYNPKSAWVSQQTLSLRGKRSGFTKDDLLAIGKENKVKKAAKIIAQIKGVLSKWPKYAATAGVKKALFKTIQEHIGVNYQ